MPMINGKPGSGLVFPREVMFGSNGLGTAWDKGDVGAISNMAHHVERA